MVKDHGGRQINQSRLEFIDKCLKTKMEIK